VTWANQVRILKEQFNALKTIIGTGLISALKPFVASMNSALSGILKFAQNVLNALGKIFGWEVEIAAGGVSMDDSIADLADGLSDVGASGDDAASGTGKAAKALEEYKRQVLSFDELHMLSAPNENNSGGSGGSGGGGGAGGSGGAGGGGTGSAGDVSVAFKRTKALYESEIDTLGELGDYIGKTLTETLQKIDWNSVYEGARSFGTGLANFLNGLFDEANNPFPQLGKTVAGAINTIWKAGSGFLGNLNFEDLGKSLSQAVDSFIFNLDWNTALVNSKSIGFGIATALNSFFKETDFTSVGKAVANFVGLKINAAFAFSEFFNFEGIGTKIGNALTGFIKETEFSKVGKTVSNFLVGAINGAASALSATDFKALGEGIKEAITSINWPGLAEAGGKLAGALLKAFVDGVTGLFGEWWGKVTEKFNTAFTEMETSLKESGVDVGKAALGGIGAGITALLGDGISWVYKTVVKPIIDGFIDGFDIHSPSHVMETYGGYIIKGLYNGILESIKGIGTWIDENIVSPFRKKLSAFFGGGADGSSALGEAAMFGSNFLESIKSGFGDVKGWVDENVVSKFTEAFGGDGENGGLETNVKLIATGEEDDTFSAVKAAWDSIVSKKPKITADAADGSKGVLDKLKTTWSKLNDKKPKITGKAKDGNPKTFNRLTGIWDKVVSKKPLLTGKARDGSGGVLDTLKTAWKKLHDKDATVKGYAQNKNASTLKTLQGSWEKVYNKDATLTAKAQFNSYTSNISPTIDSTARITKINVAADAKNSWEYQHAMGYAANGGVFAGGKWHDVAAYAGGTVSAPTGQLFVAREGGPELVGSLGNHTAVLNNDQIVASVSAGVYSAVRSAMSGVNPGGNNQAPIIEVIVKTDSETLYRQVKRGEKTYNGRYSTVATVM